MAIADRRVCMGYWVVLVVVVEGDLGGAVYMCGTSYGIVGSNGQSQGGLADVCVKVQLLMRQCLHLVRDSGARKSVQNKMSWTIMMQLPLAAVTLIRKY